MRLSQQLRLDEVEAVEPSSHAYSVLGKSELYHIILNVCYKWLIANLRGYAHYLFDESRDLLKWSAILVKLELYELVHPDVGVGEYLWTCHFGKAC